MSLADLPRFAMQRAATLDELCSLVASRTASSEGTVLLAGGTDFVVEAKQAPPRPPAEPLPLVVDVGRLAELRGIEEQGPLIRLGAATTYRELGAHPVVQRRLPLLSRMSRDVGGPTIQARGTLGGNLATASPAADGVAALAAYDATVLVQSVRGARRIPFAELQRGYKQSTRAADEVIVAFEIAPPPEAALWVWRKVGARRAQAISKVALAAVAERRGDRITRFCAAAASVAPVTALLPRTRQLIRGAALGSLRPAELDGAVDGDINPIDDLRSTRRYRAHCLRAMVRNFAGEIGVLR